MNTFSKDADRYADIIHLEHPTSRRHPRMSMEERAAQFSPFAALTGHSDAIRETERLTVQKKELSTDELDRLNAKLLQVVERIGTGKRYRFIHFVPDERKWGGAYVQDEGEVKRMDAYRNVLILTDGREIEIEQLSDLDELEID